jgi:hypothetical protein
MYVLFNRIFTRLPRHFSIRVPIYRDSIPRLPPRRVDENGQFYDWTEAEWEHYIKSYSQYYLEKAKEHPERERMGCK